MNQIHSVLQLKLLQDVDMMIDRFPIVKSTRRQNRQGTCFFYIIYYIYVFVVVVVAVRVQVCLIVCL